MPQPSVTVYTTDNCSHCVTAKHFLNKRGIEFTETNLARSVEGREKLVELTGMMSFPQIVIGEQPIGGLSELVKADASGVLEELIGQPV